MKRIKENWKHKLIVTMICTVFFTMPMIENLSKISIFTIILIYTTLPALLWVSLTYSIYQHEKQLKK